ncbi:hypothetical protein PN474_01940 [Nodularia spumigena CS-589/07]|uniref:hypothetical protein n=1 Tax=Cyanophyceae TaxID=3028117 RepID=UPI00232DBC2F|nr:MULTISPECIES: hypothetical protein [Cyanophyceae]MDB9338003.1 hypothetical protein [Nodularia spumigena CS-589/07]MDB9344117.1 hypothetical protein [Nodularia spumigena CS-588/06]MDB9400555.1 hypothetical protein [Microcystis aeruginosa CS-567/02-A1]
MAQINKELDKQRKTEKRRVEELIKKAKSPALKSEYEKMLLGLRGCFKSVRL